MFDGIKSKLGFGGDDDSYGEHGYDPRYEEDAGDDYDYGDFGDYGDGYDAEGPYDSYADSYSTVTTRPSYSSYSTSSSYSAGGRSSAEPRLVSIEDVRASTQIPESLMRDPLPARKATSSSTSYSLNRLTVDSSDIDSGALDSATYQPPEDRSQERSESLDSLFTPTAPASGSSSGYSGYSGYSGRSASAGSSSSSGHSASSAASSSSTASKTFDPYDAYAGAGSRKHEPTRSLTVLRPVSYGEVERIAKVLKAGDVVVLALNKTPATLSKRILDFSFGVASALDASVDCVADKVFVLTRGSALNEEERASLHDKGVL